jgi:hypothetical protein
MNAIIGTDFIHGKDFAIDTARHINIEGMSGVGKSSLLVNLFIEHIRQGNGGLFIDPHGDAADLIATLCPKSRMRDFVWFDPDAPYIPPFNPLHFRTPAELELGKESLFTTLKSLAGSAWGDESARVIVNAIDAVCEAFSHPTPVHVFRFMADDKFREKVLSKTKNPLLRMFKEQYDDKLRDSEQMSKFSPPINKVAKLLRPLDSPYHRSARLPRLSGCNEQETDCRVPVFKRAPRGRNRPDPRVACGFDGVHRGTETRAPEVPAAFHGGSR